MELYRIGVSLSTSIFYSKGKFLNAIGIPGERNSASLKGIRCILNDTRIDDTSIFYIKEKFLNAITRKRGIPRL